MRWRAAWAALSLLVLTLTFAGVGTKNLPSYGNEAERYSTVCRHWEIASSHGLAVIPRLSHPVFTRGEAYNFGIGADPSCNNVEMEGHSIFTAPLLLLLKRHLSPHPATIFVSLKEKSLTLPFCCHLQFHLGISFINPSKPLFEPRKLTFEPIVVSLTFHRYIEPIGIRLVSQKHILLFSRTFATFLNERIKAYIVRRTALNRHEKPISCASPSVAPVNSYVHARFSVGYVGSTYKNAFNRNKWVTLNDSSGSACSKCSYGSLHIIRLSFSRFLHGGDGAAQLPTLPEKYASLNDTNEGKNSRKTDQPPVGRRLAVSFFLILGGFSLGLLGINYLDDKGRLIGTALIGCGWLLICLGYGLWWLIDARWTWGWWF